MAFFALQVVNGREQLVATYIKNLVEKYTDTKIKRVLVPTEQLINLETLPKSVKSKKQALLPSYLFIEIQTTPNIDCHEDYYEMEAREYHLLSSLPFVVKVLKTSILQKEMRDFLAHCDQLSMTVLFSIENEALDTLETAEETSSTFEKIKEILKRNHKKKEHKMKLWFRTKAKKGFAFINAEKKGSVTCFAVPFSLVIDALNKYSLTVAMFKESPARLLQAVLSAGEVQHAKY